MRQKNTFKIILAGTVIILVLLPFAAAGSALITKLFDNWGWYAPIEKYIVPFEAKLVAASLYPLGIQTRVSPVGSEFAFYMVKDHGAIAVDLAWNCLGWQSMLLLGVSLAAGLRGQFTNTSRFEAIVFGFFGTLLMNVFRMSFVAAGIYYVNDVFAYVVHDYLSAFLTLIWLIFYWWFSYKYILEEPDTVNTELPLNTK